MSKITTLIGLFLLVVGLFAMKDGLPNLKVFSDTFLWILGGLLIWRLAGGGTCCRSKRGCATNDQPSA